MIRPPDTDAEPDTDRRDDAAPLAGRARRRFLRSTALFPVMLTLGNGLCGFASIHFATKVVPIEAKMSNLAVAAWLLVASMVLDMLDGQVARITRRTSDFGAQLDSMCDVVSFGVAPAVLMLRTIALWVPEAVAYVPPERLVWGIAALYVACGVLRLARFNVEHDDSAGRPHTHFTGLPSPAAAACVLVLVLLANDLQGRKWVTDEVMTWGLSLALPAVTLAAGLLMVSRVPYPHLVNRYMRGSKPFHHIVRLVLIVIAALFELYITGAVLALAFLASGPIRAAVRRARGLPAGEPADATPDEVIDD